MADSYWQRTLRTSISRRRALRGAAAVGAGGVALSLVGCGGGGDGDSSGGTGQIGAKDDTASAKPGGTYRTILTQDPTNFDPNLSTSFTAQGVAAHYYSRLLKFKTGPDIVPLSTIVGDAAEKFEPTDNGQTWTFKLRPNMKFHPKGPASVNGRVLDSEDVKASYDYFLSKNGSRKIVQDLVDRMETPDKTTVVFKLKEPYAPFQELMASSALFWVMSKQATAGELDTQKIEGVVGTGPWMFDRFQPSASYEGKRNPNWYEKVKASSGEVSLPLLDGIHYTVISEYAQIAAQFFAGNLDAHTPRNPDLADAVRQASNATRVANNPGWLLSFYYFNLDNAQNPFKDERLRRALSMAIDRDGIIETFGEISKLKAQGFDVNSAWSNCPIPWGDGGIFWWLDPKSSAQGDSAQWYKLNAAEAKKLLSAAGYSGAAFDLNTTSQIYGTTFDLQTEAQIPMITQLGLNAQVKITDYRSHYFPEVYTKANYPHVGYGYQTPYATVDEYLFNLVLPEGAQNHSKVNDPEISALVKKQRLEVDNNKRQSIIHDIQRKMSDKMYYVPSVVGRWGDVTLYQPYVKNAGAFRTAAYGAPTETLSRYWLDKA